MAHWYRVVTLRKGVQEGRSFNPVEFAIVLGQVEIGTTPTENFTWTCCGE